MRNVTFSVSFFFFVFLFIELGRGDCESPSVIDLTAPNSASTGWVGVASLPEPPFSCSWTLKGAELGSSEDALTYFSFKLTSISLWAGQHSLRAYDAGRLAELRTDASNQLWSVSTSTLSSASDSVVSSGDSSVRISLFQTSTSTSTSYTGFNLTWTREQRDCPRQYLRGSQLALTWQPANFITDGASCEYVWTPENTDYDFARFHFSSLLMRQPDLDFISVHNGPYTHMSELFRWPEAGKYAVDYYSNRAGGEWRYLYDVKPAYRSALLIRVVLSSSPVAPPADFGFVLNGELRKATCSSFQRLDLPSGFLEDGSGKVSNVYYETPTYCEWDIAPPFSEENYFDYIELKSVEMSKSSSDILRVLDGPYRDAKSEPAPAASDLAERGTGMLLNSITDDDTTTESSGRRMRVTWSPRTTSNYRGWLLEYAVKTRSCPTTFITNAISGVIHNANVAAASDGYTPGDDCMFLISFDRAMFEADRVFLQLEVPLFQLRTDESVTLYNGATPRAAVIGEPWTKASVTPGVNWNQQTFIRLRSSAGLSQPFMLVRFQASDRPTSVEPITRGFAIRFALRQQQLPPYTLMTASRGWFSSGKVPFFDAPDTDALIELRPSEAGPHDRLAISVVSLRLYTSYSYVRIYDGIVDSADVSELPLVAELKEETDCPVLTPGPTATIRYYSRSSTSSNSGAVIEYKLQHNSRPTLNRIDGARLGSGVISFDAGYEPGEYQEWLFDMTGVSGQLVCHFEHINIRPSFTDVVEFYRAGNPRGQMSVAVSADNDAAAGDFSIFPFWMTITPQMLVRFVASAESQPPTTSFTGFRLHWHIGPAGTAVPPPHLPFQCSSEGIPIDDRDHGFISLERQYYRDSQSCLWVLRAPPTAAEGSFWKIRLRLIDSESTHDKLQVYDGDQLRNSLFSFVIGSLPQLASWSGNLADQVVYSNHSAVTLHWSTDGSSTDNGFSVDYMLCSARDQCASEVQLLRESTLFDRLKVGTSKVPGKADAGCPVSVSFIEPLSLPPFSLEAEQPTPAPPVSVCPPGASGCSCLFDDKCEGGGSLLCSPASGTCLPRCEVSPGSLGCPCDSQSSSSQCSGSLVCDSILGCAQPALEAGSPGAECLPGDLCLTSSDSADLGPDERLQCVSDVCVIVQTGEMGGLVSCDGGGGCRCRESEPLCQAGWVCQNGFLGPYCGIGECPSGTQGCPCRSGEDASANGECSPGQECVQGALSSTKVCRVRVGCDGELDCPCADGGRCFSPLVCDTSLNACAPDDSDSSGSGCPVGSLGCPCDDNAECGANNDNLACDLAQLRCKLSEDALLRQQEGVGGSGGDVAGLTVAVAITAVVLFVLCLVLIIGAILFSSRQKKRSAAVVAVAAAHAPARSMRGHSGESGSRRAARRTRSSQRGLRAAPSSVRAAENMYTKIPD